jgi:Dolichyl-phosphate-mannose-protein mannosyltransferase
MLRAMVFLKDKTLLPNNEFYDHPYFGQIFLAAALGLIGYPDSLQPSADGDVHSIESLFLVPRILMGLLAVADTFLIYKIVERRYNNRTIAFIAALLFAVMPVTWLLRRIFLDNILLPFLLSSILFATYLKNKKSNTTRNRRQEDKKYISMVMLSGIFLGLSIFTKIPAFAFIPVVAFLVYTNSNRNWKFLGLWFIPVILIPAIWPISSYTVGEFNNWFDAIVRQATQRENKPLIDSMKTFFQIDPVLLVIGIGSIIYTCIRRDLFILLSVIPYLIFLQLVDFVSVYHLVLLLPSICIASSLMIYELSIKVKNKKIQVILPFTVISVIGVFGLLISSILINITFNSSYFKAYAVFAKQLPDNTNDKSRQEAAKEQTVHDSPTVVGRFWTKSFKWATQYVFDKKYTFVREESRRLNEILPNGQGNNNSPLSLSSVILIIDNNIKHNIQSNTSDENYDILRTLYNLTHPIQITEEKRFPYDRNKYPYSALYDNRGIGNIEIRSNYLYIHSIDSE